MSASAIADVQMSGALSQTDRGLAASGGRRSSLLGSSWETAPVLGRFRGTLLGRKRISYCFWAKPYAHGVQVVASSNLAALEQFNPLSKTIMRLSSICAAALAFAETST